MKKSIKKGLELAMASTLVYGIMACLINVIDIITGLLNINIHYCLVLLYGGVFNFISTFIWEFITQEINRRKRKIMANKPESIVSYCIGVDMVGNRIYIYHILIN